MVISVICCTTLCRNPSSAEFLVLDNPVHTSCAGPPPTRNVPETIMQAFTAVDCLVSVSFLRNEFNVSLKLIKP
jgi:hypothetical protein